MLSGFHITSTVIAQDGLRMDNFSSRRFWRLTPGLVVFLGSFAVDGVDTDRNRATAQLMRPREQR